MGASASAGRYLGSRWTLLGTFNHERSLGASASRTRLGARVVRGQPRGWRAWLGAEGDLPVAGLGRDTPRVLSVSTGAVVLR